MFFKLTGLTSCKNGSFILRKSTIFAKSPVLTDESLITCAESVHSYSSIH